MGQYYGGLAQMVDTWNYHHHGLIEYRLLESDPKQYLTNLFYDPYHNEEQIPFLVPTILTGMI
jgi:hypothetical protein